MDRNEPASPRGPDHVPADVDAQIDEVVDRVLATPAGAGRWPVAALNPAAGHHAIASEPRELRAALRAGERTWRRFPYLERRYGERGRRFTRSDSAWIVTLARWPQAVAERHLRWLGELLAARGMPRWILEVHLEVLHAELLAALPDRRAAYAAFLLVAAAFRDERTRRVDEATAAALAAEFDRRVGPASTAALPEAGALLVAAVADERAGVARAVASLVAWLADRTRFPADWIAAVDWTVEAARARDGGRDVGPGDREAPRPGDN